MPYRTFFCYANSTQEAEEWIKILQWKLVGVYFIFPICHKLMCFLVVLMSVL